MLRPFIELITADVSAYVSKKPVFKKQGDKFVETGKALDYISWVDCLILLYEFGAEKVAYGNVLNNQGHSLFIESGRCPEVRVYVDVDGERFELTYPVIDGSKDIPPDKITQSDVHNATQRAFVKCVAVNTGLGLSLWQKEEKQALATPPKTDESMHSISVCVQRVRKKYSEKLQNYDSMSGLNEALNLTEYDLKAIFQGARDLKTLEENLNKL